MNNTAIHKLLPSRLNLTRTRVASTAYAKLWVPQIPCYNTSTSSGRLRCSNSYHGYSQGASPKQVQSARQHRTLGHKGLARDMAGTSSTRELPGRVAARTHQPYADCRIYYLRIVYIRDSSQYLVSSLFSVFRYLFSTDQRRLS